MQLAATDRGAAPVAAVGKAVGKAAFGKLAAGLSKLGFMDGIDIIMTVWSIVDMFTHTSPDSAGRGFN